MSSGFGGSIDPRRGSFGLILDVPLPEAVEAEPEP